MDARPTRVSAAVFSTKATLLRAHRTLTDLTHPLPRLIKRTTFLHFTAALSATPLWLDPTPSEQWYQRGKVENLRLAAARFDATFIPAGHIFSFWRQLGKATAAKGFQPGRMLLEGCMVPAIGGGLCQLSNALYQVALDAGCEILERHRHSRLVPGSASPAGRDATVAWNYIDLRFRPRTDSQLRIQLTTIHLIVSLLSNTPPPPYHFPREEMLASPIADDHACDTCAASKCHKKHTVPGA